jgi:hypothetical protein
MIKQWLPTRKLYNKNIASLVLEMRCVFFREGVEHATTIAKSSFVSFRPVLSKPMLLLPYAYSMECLSM